MITSLALDIAILWAIGGAALSFGKDGPRRKAKFDVVAGSVHPRALSRVDRRTLGRDIKKSHSDQCVTQENLSTNFQNALHLLRDETFVVTTFQNIMEQHALI